MPTPLPPSDWFPANVPDISTRRITLSTGVTLRVAESGDPQAAPVVLLHGWGASLYTFRHALTLMPSEGFRAIAVDLRGYGLSDRPSARGAYSLDAYKADLDALLDALNLSRALLVGHSMGGGIALRYALETPGRVSALALVNPSNLAPIPWKTLLQMLPRRPLEDIDHHLVPRWLVREILRRIAYSDASRPTERDVDEYWAPTQLGGYVRTVRAAIDEFDWQPLSAAESAGLTVSSLVILGAQDRLLKGTKEPASRLHGAEVVLMEGGHCVHEEYPQAVYMAIGKFLREVR